MTMSLLQLSTTLLIIFSVYTDAKSNHTQFCKSTKCHKKGPEIRFPFRLNTQPAECGLPGYQLSCSSHDTILQLATTRLQVHRISYLDSRITVADADQTTCPVNTLQSLNLSTSRFHFPRNDRVVLPVAVLNCQANISGNNNNEDVVVAPSECASSDLVFVAAPYMNLDKLPPHSNCRVAQVSCIPQVKSKKILKPGSHVKFNEMVVEFLNKRRLLLDWEPLPGCRHCQKSGRFCGFDSTTRSTICVANQESIPIIIGVSIGGSMLIALFALIIYLKFIRADNERKIQLKVEKFLEEYNSMKPTRYTYNDLKKMTSKFKYKLGQGGYGSVYKGKLSSGIPIAVKVLEHSTGNGEDFINEVSIISRIHHFNIVRPLGFCSEGTRRAIIYEFVFNGSLEKFIFTKNNRSLSWERLQKIAFGVARGVEYLHQGCKHRILHFDIKPHNILLDHHFQPKISDFGLAKLCSKEISIVSMTAARGTIGYIAPELYSRNFGEVSYKSDVFSYGMMLLEMVGCRKNVDLTMEDASEVYFPEWVYNKVSQGNEIGVEMEEDEKIAKKLAIVGLWCIQWNPVDRPSMTMVMQMLEADLQSLEIPPRPFVS